MRIAYAALLVTLCWALSGAPAYAHHEIAGFDLEHPLTVGGVVREFVWANPHVMLYLEVPKASAGIDVWTLEGGAVQALARRGWARDSLHRGDRVEVLLAPRREVKYSGQILRVTRSDGQVLSVGMRTP